MIDVIFDDELKNKWINALRSGKYKQGTGQLKNDDGSFCCLGVLADLLGEEWDSGTAKIFGKETEKYDFLDDKIISYDIQKDLAEKNDSGMSFYDISFYIENNFEEDIIDDEDEYYDYKY